MTTLRPCLRRGAMVTVLAGCSVLLPAAAAAAQEPDIAGWWSAANTGGPAPAPPPPPDVGDGDLFVQGSNSAPPIGAAPASSSAVAALAFQLQPTDVVTGMTLQIAGSPPPQASVVACRATVPFTSAHNGPWTQAPSYASDACVAGQLKDHAVVFADVGKLVNDSRLAVVVVPGALDRVVFSKPGRTTLTVQQGIGLGDSAPPLSAGGHQGSAVSAYAPSSSSGALGGSAVVPPLSNGLVPGTAATVGASAVVAAPELPVPLTPQARSAQSASSGLSTGARRGIGFVVIALEVLGYLLLRRLPNADAARELPTASTSGRLRPPDRVGSPLRRETARSGGVGRFQRERHGPAPHL